ncbi:hypothetical protein [Streptomyces roseolus]|uniref:hypothetical protein n=1 Tax=Streptomyces roseolus TaxID=67358 RepID=UPI0016724E4E|nr:hypothetical protein [Streptomyces roseolus]GGR20885.1 hypothetical protein GCM10010282_11160 [Streptomyces roseolus]
MDEQERDPLELVLFPEDGGPPRPGTGDDPDVARALADVALIREQLGVLADALTAPPEPRVRPRRARAVAWALAACAALGVLGTGGAWLAARPGGGGVDGAGDDAKRTPGGIVACATDVAEGTVARAEPLPGEEAGAYRVVLRVERTYKPTGGGPGELAFEGWAADRSYYRPGARMVVVVSRLRGEGVLTFREDREPPGELGLPLGPVRDELEYGRAWVAAALAEGPADCSGEG